MSDPKIDGDPFCSAYSPMSMRQAARQIDFEETQSSVRRIDFEARRRRAFATTDLLFGSYQRNGWDRPFGCCAPWKPARRSRR